MEAESRGTTKEFGGDHREALDLDVGDGYTTICICQNSQNCIPETMDFTVYNLF